MDPVLKMDGTHTYEGVVVPGWAEMIQQADK